MCFFPSLYIRRAFFRRAFSRPFMQFSASLHRRRRPSFVNLFIRAFLRAESSLRAFDVSAARVVVVVMGERMFFFEAL